MIYWQHKFAWRVILLALGGLLLAAPTIPVLAINYGSGTYGGCQFGSCSLTIGSNGTVGVNVNPTASGSCTIQSDSVSVLTGSTSGYTLTLADSSTNASLIKGGDGIVAASASQVSPAALTANTWGYRVDGVGGFGSGPTAAQTNQSISATKFAGVPASNTTAATIAATSVPADPAVVTTIWYGVCANTSVTSGIYATQVTYTAVTN